MTRLVGFEVRVRPVIDQAADDHLSNLKRGDQHHDEFRWKEAHGTESVVRIHQRMNAVVHHDEPARRRGVLLVSVPCVQQHCDVMVPM